MNLFTLILSILVITYFSILISTYIFQRNLLYHPTENNYSGDQILVDIEKVTIKTRDNIKAKPFSFFLFILILNF